MSRLVALIDLIALDTMLSKLKILLDIVLLEHRILSGSNQASEWIDGLTFI